MKSRERIVIYGALALLLLVNSSAILGLAGTSGGQAWAAAMAVLDGLGPAPSLTLTGEDGKDVVLRGKEAHLAWADDAHSRAYSLAFVHTGKPITQLMNSDAFKDERQTLRDELQKQDDVYRGQLQDLREEMEKLERGSPQFDESRQRGQKLYEEAMQWRAQAEQRGQKLDADQFERAYRDVVSAVEVIAERRKIDIVYRFIPTSEAFEAKDSEDALNSIRLRTVVKYPEALDITPEVLQEMSLKVE